MTPRPYQLRAIGSARAKFSGGAKSVLLVSPTGSGKTYMLALIAAGHLERRATNRVVWLAHRTELLDQAAAALCGLGLDVSMRGASPGARVHVESIQTILARGTAPEGTLLIADEAHHFAEANRCGEVVRLYPLVLGATATPERGDGKPLRPPFSEIVVAAQISELVRAGYLVPLRIRGPELRLGPKKMAQRPVDVYLASNRGERAICFAGNLKSADAIADDFVALGVRAKVVSGRTPPDERGSLLASHRAGDIDVLVNCGVLTEGYDDPAVSVVIVARGCGSQGLWLQMTGRGLRPSPGKNRCMLHDMCGMVYELGRPDEDRTFSLDGEPIVLTGRKAKHGPRLCRSCKAPLGDMTECPECGLTGQPLPKIAGVDMVDIDVVKRDVRDAMGIRKDALALAGLYRKPGRSPEQALAMFRSFFKRNPDVKCVSQAREYNRILGVEVARREDEIRAND